MRIAFVRTSGKPDRVYVKRTSGTEVSWSFPTFGNDLPHDLVHLVVEAMFGVHQGFWARVDAGVDVARINAMANRQGGAGKYAAFGTDLSDLYLAEVLAAVPWSLSDLDDEERYRAAVRGSAGAEIELPPQVTVERIREVRETLDALRHRWRRLAPSGALNVSFDPASQTFTVLD
jgi:hypothetical protein